MTRTSEKVLRVHELRERRYYETNETWLEEVGLGVTLWSGVFEGRQDVWLRWCDREGNVLPTGDERASLEKQRAQQPEERAQQAEERAQQSEEQASLEKQRAQILAEKFLKLGIDPDTV